MNTSKLPKELLDDALFDLAFDFKQSKIWKKFRDTQLFAVMDQNGGINYCSILGRGGELSALAVYPGTEGLQTYRQVLKEPAFLLGELATSEQLTVQDCIMLSLNKKIDVHPRNLKVVQSYCKRKGKTLRGKNAYPAFERFRPSFYPWHLTEESEVEIIRIALEATLCIAERIQNELPETLGFFDDVAPGAVIPLLKKNSKGVFKWEETVLPDEVEPNYPKGFLDDISAAGLKKKRKNHRSWGIHILMYPEAVAADELLSDGMPEEAPFFPYVMLVVDEKQGLVVTASMLETSGMDVQKFSRDLIEAIGQHGRPNGFYCIDERTEAFLSDFSAKLGIKTILKEEDEVLEDVIDAFYDRMDDVGNSLLDMVYDGLCSPELVREMPDEILEELMRVGRDLPDEIQNIIMREYFRRCKNRN